MALYKRPTSKYYWMKFYFDGQLIQQSTKCKARRDAETVESAFRTQLALGKIGIQPPKKAPTFEKAVEELKIRKVPISFTKKRDKSWSCYFLDPDGNKLEITSWPLED